MEAAGIVGSREGSGGGARRRNPRSSDRGDAGGGCSGGGWGEGFLSGEREGRGSRGEKKGGFLFLVFGGLRELGRGELLPNYAKLWYGMVQRQMHAAPPSLV